MKAFALFVFFLLPAGLSYAQQSRQAEKIVLEYEPETKQFNLSEQYSFRNGQKYQFVLRNINTAMFNSNMEIKSYQITAEVPEFSEGLSPYIKLLSPLTLLDIGPFVAPMIEGLKPDSVTVAKETILLANYWALADTALNRLSILQDSAISLYKEGQKQLNNKSQQCPGYNIIAKEKKTAIENLKFKTVNDVYEEMAIVQAAYEQAKLVLEKEPAISHQTLRIYGQIRGIQENLNANKSKYLKSFEFIHKSVEAEGEVLSVVRKAEKDVMQLKIVMVDAFLQDTVVEQSMVLYTPGRWKISFYTGGFYNNLVESDYYLTARDSTTKVVGSEAVNRMDVAFGGVGVLEKSFVKGFSAGPGIGAALSPFDGNLRFLAALSASFGRKNKLGLQFGYAWSKMNHLSAAVQLDEETGELVVPASVTEVPTYKKVKDGWFVGLSYSIGKVQLD